MTKIKYDVLETMGIGDIVKQKIKASGNFGWLVELYLYRDGKLVEAEIDVATKYPGYNTKALSISAKSIKAVMCFVKKYIEYLDQTDTVMVVPYNDKKYKQLVSEGWMNAILCKSYQHVSKEEMLKQYIEYCRKMSGWKQEDHELNVAMIARAIMVTYKYINVMGTRCGIACCLSIPRRELAKKAIKHAIEFCSNIEGKINIV